MGRSFNRQCMALQVYSPRQLLLLAAAPQQHFVEPFPLFVFVLLLAVQESIEWKASTAYKHFKEYITGMLRQKGKHLHPKT